MPIPTATCIWSLTIWPATAVARSASGWQRIRGSSPADPAPRIQHAVIPVGAAWLNLIEGWWRIFRRKAFAGQSLADHHEIAYVTRIATAQRNRHATPWVWVWGRPPPPHRPLRRCFVYRLCGTTQ